MSLAEQADVPQLARNHERSEDIEPPAQHAKYQSRAEYHQVPAVHERGFEVLGKVQGGHPASAK